MKTANICGGNKHQVDSDRSAVCRIVYCIENRERSTCQTRDAGHGAGLQQSRPGHKQQGVNLTLITHTYADTAQPASTVYTHIYTVQKKHTNTHSG